VCAVCLGASAVVGAAPALAVTHAGQNIYGSGSSLQLVAQTQVWDPLWHANPTVDQPTLNNDPAVTNYNPTGSGPGLAEFGNTTGVLDETQDPVAQAAGQLDAYTGSDDPPGGPLGTAGTNLTNASAAASGAATTKIDEVTVPVAEAPVAVIFSLPSGITAGTGSLLQLTNQELQSIWSDKIPKSAHYAANTYGAILEEAHWTHVAANPKAEQFTDAGGSTGGGSTVTLQARAKGSGTTYTFRGFLYLSHDPTYTIKTVNDSNTLANPNGWPASVANINETGNTNGPALVDTTTTTPGSVGYANLADAVESPDGSYGAHVATPTAASLSAALVTGSPITSLPVNLTGLDIPSGTKLTIITGASHTQVWTTTADAPAGSTSISVSSQAPNFAYPSGAILQAPSLAGLNQIVFAEVQDNFPLSGTQKPQYQVPGAAGAPNIYLGADINTGGGAGTAGCPLGQHAGVGCWQVPTVAGKFDPTGSWGPLAPATTGGTLPADPDVFNDSSPAVNAYPIVATTYDLGWTHYAEAGSNLVGDFGGTSAEATAAGFTAASLLQYEVNSSKGQKDLAAAKVDYGKLPAAIDADAVKAAADVRP
jgi:hypothetical protein